MSNSNAQAQFWNVSKQPEQNEINWTLLKNVDPSTHVSANSLVSLFIHEQTFVVLGNKAFIFGFQRGIAYFHIQNTRQWGRITFHITDKHVANVSSLRSTLGCSPLSLLEFRFLRDVG